MSLTRAYRSKAEELVELSVITPQITSIVMFVAKAPFNSIKYILKFSLKLRSISPQNLDYLYCIELLLQNFRPKRPTKL